MTDDTQDDDADTDDETCPICGQEYDHKREERQAASSPDTRADAVECKKTHGMKRTVYVHLTDKPQRVSKTVVADDNTDEKKGLGALFS